MALNRNARRFRRVLELVPWVLTQKEAPTVVETCQRFGLTRAELVDDLDLLIVCGLHPFTPDTMIDAWIDDDRVVVRSDLFTRRPRPSPGEALRMIAAARAVAQTPGAPEALRTGLAKLEAALPGELGRSLVIDLEAPEELAELRRALADERRVEIEYFSYGRDALTTRRVDPAEVFLDKGSWYLTGWCHLAEAPRCFRVDRIRSLIVLDESAERAAEAKGMEPTYAPSEDDLRVTLVISRDASWLREYYPLESEEELPDGHARVVLSTASADWLARLLLRLGGSARVEEPARVAESVRRAAQRVLARYG